MAEYYSVETAKAVVESFVDKYGTFSKLKDYSFGAYDYLFPDFDEMAVLEGMVCMAYKEGSGFTLSASSFMGNLLNHLNGAKAVEDLELSMRGLEKKIREIGLSNCLK